MALIDKASLLFVPSVVAQEKAFNILPSGNRAPDNKGGAGYDQTRADFDFDRGSNAAATRIGSDGLLKKYQENLLLQSNQFDTTWTNTSATETSGFEGYDGSNNAWKLEKTGNGGRIRQTVSLTGVNTFSVYAKAGTTNWLRLLFETISDSYYFDLENGVLGSGTSQPVDGKIESVGNGWYRCSVTGSGTSGAVRIYPADDDLDVTGTTGSIYIQNAQLETGLVATEYLNSTSVTAKAGVLIDLPRINFDANGENGALLLEPSRQQLITQSEYFASSDWIKINSTITNNSVVSPEGLQNAATHTNTASNQVFLYQYPSGTGTTFTCSVFAKKNTNKYLGITMTYDSDTTKRYQVIFNLEDGTFAQQKDSAFTLTNRDYDIEDYGNGWYRCSITSTGTNGRPYMVLQNSNILSVSFGDVSLDWNDATIGSAYYYGAQLEANASYATSYIPNHSGTGGVTRAADVNTLSNAISLDGDFALFWEGAVFEDDIMLYGSGTNAWYMNYTTSSGRIILDELSGRKVAAYLGSGTATGVKTKILIKRVSGVHSVFANGAKLTNTTSVNSTNTLSLSSMFWAFSSSFYKGLEVNQSFVSKTELTDAECVTLTTL